MFDDDEYESAESGKVVCVTSEGEKHTVAIDTLLQSHLFRPMCEHLEPGQDFNGEFPLGNVTARVFKKVIEWCENHKGQPDPVIEQDPITRVRKWFTFTDYEKSFFDVPVEQLEEFVMAANYLDIKILYYYGCQAIAALLTGKSPEEIRAIFGLKDDLTEEEKAELRRQNPWCNY